MTTADDTRPEDGPGGTDTAAALDAARTLVADLAKRAKDDPGVVFEPDVLAALRLLHDRDKANWVRVHGALKKIGFPMSELNVALKPPKAEPSGFRLVDADFIGETDRTAGSMLADAPNGDLNIPLPYFVREDATGFLTAKHDQLLGTIQVETVIAHAPILIDGRLRDEEEGIEALRLTWRRRNGWLGKTVDRGIALDARQLVKLADDGAPVTSGNASELVPYLDALEAANQDLLPSARVSSHLGFQGDRGERGFLVGRTLILPTGDEVAGLNLAELPPSDWREDYVSFRGAGAGDEQIADAYRAEGTMDGWREAVRALEGHPRALLAFYGSFAPPILFIARAPNFIVDVSNRTSTGKTTALRSAASVWGNPDERAAATPIGSWDATKVWQERASAVLNALPLLLDDTKRAKEPKIVAEMLYAVANGRGRGRGNVRGLARTRTWRTVLISTGEAPATSFTQDGGTRMRTLSVRGSPFGAATDETRRLVDILNVGVMTHYGHAGPAFIRWLYGCRSEWDQLGEAYRAYVHDYAERAQSAEAGRLAQYAALLTLTASLVHAALDLPWAYDEPLAVLWDELAAEASDAAGDLRALRDVVSWSYSHAPDFHGREEYSPNGQVRIPNGGWAGRWDRGPDWEYLALYPTVLDKVLRDLRYEPEAILAGWQERGWLLMEKGGGRARKTRVGSSTPRMIQVTREAIDGLD